MMSLTRCVRPPRAVPAGVAALAAVVALLGGCGEDREPAAGGERSRGEAGRERPRAEAPLEGGERVVFVGDSLAVEAPPNYPELLPGALERRAPGIAVANLAEPGTTAADWLPGSPLFTERLRPELGRADLLVVTLGGNDLQEALGGRDGLDSLATDPASTGNAVDAVERFERRLERLFAAVRRMAPGTAIAYVGYPDYSRASVWQQAAGASGTLALRIGLASLLEAARSAGPDLVVEMDEPTAEAGVDSLLADSEHLNAAGHELYATELARALAGTRAR